MKYFLTGATGFIGGRIARQLRELGHEVVALVRTPANAHDLEALGVILQPGESPSPAFPVWKANGVFQWPPGQLGARDSATPRVSVIDGTRHVLRPCGTRGFRKGCIPVRSVFRHLRSAGGRNPSVQRNPHQRIRPQQDCPLRRRRAADGARSAARGRAAGLVAVRGPEPVHESLCNISRAACRSSRAKPPTAGHVEDVARAIFKPWKKGGTANPTSWRDLHILWKYSDAERLTGIPAPRPAWRRAC
jgi:hypothetical protein